MTDYALELQSVHKSFGTVSIIRGVDLTIKRGERHAIIGPNGAGKSTLFNLISGAFKPTSGKILLNGESSERLAAFQIARRGLSRSFQITNVLPRMTVLENIRCAAMWTSGRRYQFWGRSDRMPELEMRTAKILDDVGLTHRRGVVAGLLSYAEQRTLELGITIAGGANVILLDEPTAGMSREETERAITVIRQITKDNTLLIVEHDMGVVFDLADRISVLVYGKVLASGTPDEIRCNAEVKEAYLGQDPA